MLDDGEFRSVQIGAFFSFAKANDEFGVSLIGEARIPKRNAKLCETIRRMYESGNLAFSFEIMVSVVSEVNGTMVIDAAEGNELIGMAIVSVPAYPEAKALKLIAEEQKEEDDMEVEKKLAEAEARLKLAEEKNQEDKEALKQKDEELSAEKKKYEEAEAALASAQTAVAEKENCIAELEAQVAELTPYKAEAETLKAEKAAAELAAKKQELTAFAEAQGLDVKNETVAAASEAVDYAALVAETMKQEKKPEAKPTLAAYAMGGGMNLSGDYGDLLGKA